MSVAINVFRGIVNRFAEPLRTGLRGDDFTEKVFVAADKIDSRYK